MHAMVGQESLGLRAIQHSRCPSVGCVLCSRPAVQTARPRKSPPSVPPSQADATGALEAVKAAVGALPQDRVAPRFLLAAASDISASDVDLAFASEAVILGFNVEPNEAAQAAAKQYGAVPSDPAMQGGLPLVNCAKPRALVCAGTACCLAAGLPASSVQVWTCCKFGGWRPMFLSTPHAFAVHAPDQAWRCGRTESSTTWLTRCVRPGRGTPVWGDAQSSRFRF